MFKLWLFSLNTSRELIIDCVLYFLLIYLTVLYIIWYTEIPLVWYVCLNTLFDSVHFNLYLYTP